jgi:uncharacterized repeat protein (TIGR01451 family)
MCRRRTIHLAVSLVASILATTALLLLLGNTFKRIVHADTSVNAPTQDGDVEISPGVSETVDPGTIVTYHHTLTNTGAAADTFAVYVTSPQGWPSVLLGGNWPSGTLVPPLLLESLDSLATGTFTISLTVPPTTSAGLYYTIVTATSQNSDTVRVTTTNTTTIQQKPGIKLSSTDRQWVNPGNIAMYTHAITNTGNVDYTLDLTATSSLSWPLELLKDLPTGTLTLPLSLGAGMTETFVVSLTVPSDAAPGTVDLTVITATSRTDPQAQAVTTDTTAVKGLYLPLVLRHYPPLPVGSIEIQVQGEATTVHQPLVTLALSATVSGDTVTDMRFGGNGVDWGDWEPYTVTKAFTLTHDISGLKTVYAQFRGSIGGISGPVYDRIYLLLNGDFETGEFSPWQNGGELNQFINSTQPHTGNYSALLGDPSYPENGIPEGSAWVDQEIVVPSTAAATLGFWYRIFTYDVMWSAKYKSYYDYLDVELRDSGGNTVRILRDGFTGEWQPDTLRDLGWRHHSFDLSAYKGQTVRIRFANFNTGGVTNDPRFNTYTYLDDITVDGDW